MPNHTRFVFATVAVLALAACQGGANVSNSLPVTNEQSSNLSGGDTLASAQTYVVPASAPSGVRTYVHLPLRNGAQLDKLIQQQSTKNSPLYHHWLTPQQFRESYGPTAADLQAAAAALRNSGFKTTITSQGIIADAQQATVERTFGIHLHMAGAAMNNARGAPILAADRAPTIPAALSNVHAQVIGFVPFKPKPMFAFAKSKPISPENRYGPLEPYYWFDDLKQAYQYPSYGVAHGSGRTIAIVSVSDFLDSDMALYFGHEHLRVPQIERRPVDGGAAPFDPNSGAAYEVSLDIQQAGGSAPGAKILVYGVPQGTFGQFMDMYTAIVEDNKADVVSTSFGECELFFLPSYNGGQSFVSLLQAFHDIFRQGNSQGITFVTASGDNGSQGGECTDPSGSHAVVGVSIWANDPAVTGVGGTNLATSYIPGSLRSTYVSENAYDDKFAPGQGFANGAIWGSGGGKSVIFSKPLYQYLVRTDASTRAVPDLAMHMGGCPVGAITPCGPGIRSADITVVGGGLYLLIGTSASTPEFAGLQAVQDQTLGGRAGNANYLIYTLAAFGTVGNGPVFHNRIPGNNGYPTHPGYNFVVGNGTPHAAQYALFPFGPFAGDPQTPSNP